MYLIAQLTSNLLPDLLLDTNPHLMAHLGTYSTGDLVPRPPSNCIPERTSAFDNPVWPTLILTFGPPPWFSFCSYSH